MIIIGKTIPARRTDPQTSHDGYQDVKVRANTQRYQLLESYASGDELIAQEASDRAGMSAYAGSKRNSELLQGRYIRDTGETRRATTGSSQRVCVITTKGREALSG